MSDTPRTDAKEKETYGCAIKTHAYYGWKQARVLERELAAERKRADEAEQRHADATGEWQRQKEAAQILLDKYWDSKKRADDAHTALEEISKIRDDIIGRQQVNWSAHIYPLVAALKVAGYKGIGYEAARDEAMKNG